MSKYNLPVVFVLIIYPIFITLLCVCYIISYHFGSFEIVLFLLGYYITNITVGIGLHRLWSHNSYKLNRYIEFVLILLSAGTLQGPILSWVSNHLRHHTYTDTDFDPHSSIKYKSRIKSFWWSHMGWMLTKREKYNFVDKITMLKLGKKKLLKWQLRHYWIIAAFMNTVVPALAGYIVTHSILGAYAGFIFIGWGRAIQQQMTFSVNSLCHFFGDKRYIQSTAGDIWWLALFLLGENWHNYHHAFPSDYRNGVKWYQLDIHKWIIYLMSLLGLASDLRRTERLRVEAKIFKTTQDYLNLQKKQLELINSKILELNFAIQKKVNEITKKHLGKNFIDYLFSLLNNLGCITQQLNRQLKSFDKKSQERVLYIINKKVKKIELLWIKVCNQLEVEELGYE